MYVNKNLCRVALWLLLQSLSAAIAVEYNGISRVFPFLLLGIVASSYTRSTWYVCEMRPQGVLKWMFYAGISRVHLQARKASQGSNVSARNTQPHMDENCLTKLNCLPIEEKDDFLEGTGT
jgi:hypothetical protein